MSDYEEQYSPEEVGRMVDTGQLPPSALDPAEAGLISADDPKRICCICGESEPQVALMYDEGDGVFGLDDGHSICDQCLEEIQE